MNLILILLKELKLIVSTTSMYLLVIHMILLAALNGSLTVDFNLSLTKSLKTLIISMLLSFFIVKFMKLYVVLCRII